MKFTRIILAVLAGAALLSGCAKEDLSSKEPSIELSRKKFDGLTKDQQSVTFTIAATRDWEIKNTVDWIAFEPSKGAASSKGQTVTATVLENTGMNRSVTLTVKAGLAEESILFSQEGPQGGITDGDGTKAKPYSASQAHALAAKLAAGATSSDKVYIKGIISKLHPDHTAEKITQYGNGTFFITDDGNENKDTDFLCFQVYYLGAAKFTSADQVKVGDVVTVYGKYTHYKGESGKSTYETEGKGAAYIYELNGLTAESTATEMTIDQAIAAKTGFAIVTGRVLAASKNGFIINDGTQNNMFVPKPETTVKVGDIVKVTGALNEYGKCIRLGDANNHEDIVVETSTATIAATPEQTPVAVAQTEFSAFDCGGSAKMVTIAGGTLTSSPDATDPSIKYYNLDYGTDVKPAGSVYTGRDLSGYLDKKLKVTGYYCGKTSNWFMVMETAIEEDNTKSFNVTPATVSVGSAAGSKASISVSGDVAWTATASSADVTLNPSSGTGAATIEVTLAENTTFVKRTYKVTVSTTEDALVKSYEVTVNQDAAVDPSLKMVELTNAEICAALEKNNSTSTTYTELSFGSASGTWTANAQPAKTNKWIQIRDTKASFLKSPEFTSNIQKIEISTDANKAVLVRTFYAIPSTTTLTSSSDGYEKTIPSVLSSAYGSVTTGGLEKAGNAGEVGETVTLTFNSDVKSFMLVTTPKGSENQSGASYINSIKVYLK